MPNFARTHKKDKPKSLCFEQKWIIGKAVISWQEHAKHKKGTKKT